MTNRRFFWCLFTLLCAAVVLICIGRYTSLDILLADRFFDQSAAIFPARDSYLFEKILHQTMKTLMICLGVVPPIALLADRMFDCSLFQRNVRKGLYVVMVSSLTVPLVISLLKYFSVQHCPWDLLRYGGSVPYLRIFDALPAGVAAGRCFPAGHASSALWLASVAAFWLPARPARAMGIFLVALLPGLVLGLAQQARGAHFLTHTLWSIWITAFVVLMLSRLMISIPVHTSVLISTTAKA